MPTLRRSLPLILLVFGLSFGRAVQKNQAAEEDIVSLYIPILSRSEDSLYPIGPQGGSIVVMEMDPNNTNILYAGTWGGGMYKSLDGGLNWHTINQGLSNLYINSLAMDPTNPAILYAGTYENGVYKTTDAGATWRPTGPGMTNLPIVYTLAVDPVTSNVVYAGTRNHQPGPPWGGGLYKSTNGGDTWINSSNGLGEDWVYDIKVDSSSHNTVYVATHSQGVYKSTDAAANWGAVNNGITDFSTRSIVIDPTNPLIVYVGTWHYGGVFKTVDGGQSWEAFSSGLNHKIYSLQIDPKNTNILYAATDLKGIMVTENGGSDWHSVGLDQDFIYNLMIDPLDTSEIYAGTMGDGLYKSTDRGQNWLSSNTGLLVANITGLVAHWTVPITTTVAVSNTLIDAVYTSVYGGGVYKTTDLGKNWIRINNGLGELWVHSLAMSRTDPQTLYAGLDSTGFYISTDGGGTWVASNTGLPASAAAVTLDAWADPNLRSDLFDQAFIEAETGQNGQVEAAASTVPVLSIGVDSFDPQKLTIGTQGAGIFQSQNGGGSWSSTNLQTQLVYTILSDPFTTTLLYAGCDASSNALYRSLDGGATWNLSNAGITGLTVYALAADPATPGVIYAGTSAGLFKSVDNAQSWGLFGLSGQIVTAVGLYKSDPKTIFAGTSNGLFVSYDGGGTWKPLNYGLVNKEITFVALDPGGPHHLDLIGTTGGGVLRHEIVSPAPK